jgi:hypothetical protein
VSFDPHLIGAAGQILPVEVTSTIATMHEALERSQIARQSIASVLPQAPMEINEGLG